ncbi:MAG TPA: trigger factor [Candidatus Ratteibacteria bacterium]|jgi:FKBP-type peptidyl-prolyl cis-trans isomerase (trigger factor)|uniref:Trigger factor n=1 Tax=candidate division TA06 bacterium ADurb.Bin131 TaxID=1852827 RepID=A0A1V6CEF2_UNCT6|nr:MAG: Trigger factor [candidate division TA06 bacterium ADurb.Bin131]HOC02169.1 trigger factor [bacterium]HRS07097.1 trigger factor [Candidatus Ratteibacteria bacterium]HON05790.1 trigger factor [bacterium]HPC30170.1 trigger factor [bacterium]
MKTEIQELPKYGRKILVEIEAERVSKEKKAIIEEIQETAEIPGFRKGKVPIQIIETRFADEIEKKIVERLIKESYITILDQSGLVPVIEPEISDVKLGETLNFCLYFEIRPEVVVNKYKGLVVKQVDPEPVTEEMVDNVLVDLEKKKEFASTIIDLEKRAAWKKKIRQQLEQLSANRAKNQEEEQLWKQLFENSKVEIPEKLMRQRAWDLMKRQLGYMDTKGKTNEEVEKIAMEIFEKMKPIAEEQLKKYFILSEIADIEKIEVSDEDVEKEISRISLTSGEDVETVRKKLASNGKIEDIREDLRIEKAFEVIKNNASNIKSIVLPGEEKHYEDRKKTQQL